MRIKIRIHLSYMHYYWSSCLLLAIPISLETWTFPVGELARTHSPNTVFQFCFRTVINALIFSHRSGRAVVVGFYFIYLFFGSNPPPHASIPGRRHFIIIFSSPHTPPRVYNPFSFSRLPFARRKIYK